MVENDDTLELIDSIPEELPVMPLNDAVVYPYMLIPLIVTPIQAPMIYIGSVALF